MSDNSYRLRNIFLHTGDDNDTDVRRLEDGPPQRCLIEASIPGEIDLGARRQSILEVLEVTVFREVTQGLELSADRQMTTGRG